MTSQQLTNQIATDSTIYSLIFKSPDSPLIPVGSYFSYASTSQTNSCSTISTNTSLHWSKKNVKKRKFRHMTSPTRTMNQPSIYSWYKFCHFPAKGLEVCGRVPREDSSFLGISLGKWVTRRTLVIFSLSES